MTREFDLIIAGGTIVDGTGGPSVVADVGVRAGLVVAVDDLASAAAVDRVDAKGLLVTPGLIDTHSHADVANYLPDQEPFAPSVAPLLQGVTTEVCGNCGFSPFPVIDTAHAVEPFLAAVFGKGAPTYPSFEDYREAAHATGLPTNLAPLVGHGTLRASVIGLDDRAVTSDELERMTRLLEESLDQGAFGMSSGLIYPPALFASTDEVRTLAAACGRFDRPYATHMRSETDAVMAALDEAARIAGDRTALHVSHHKVAGRRNFGRSAETLEWITTQRTAGRDISLDAYPYTAGSTTMLALLPPHANDGDLDDRLARLASRSVRDQIRATIRDGHPGWENLVAAAGWNGIVIAGAPGTPAAEGRSMTDLADGRDPVDVMCDLLRAERGAVTVVVHMMDQRDVDAIITSPFAMIGSDGVPLPGRPHPRLTGTFAKVLAELSRDRRLLELGDAVRRMTSTPADRFGLTGRGRVAVGSVADLAAFDMSTLAEQGSYEDPWRAPVGVRHVVVGGVVGVRDGRDTGRRAGAVLTA